VANPSVTPKVGRDGTVKFYDNAGAGGANTFTASFIRGDFSANAGAKAEAIDIFVRGIWKGRRRGNNPIHEGSFSLPLVQFTNGTNDVILDVLDGTGAIGLDWTKHTASIEEWNVGMLITIEGTDHGDAADHTLDFQGVVLTWDLAESPNGETSINVSWSAPNFATHQKGGPS
jgi:hypothetical protein